MKIRTFLYKKWCLKFKKIETNLFYHLLSTFTTTIYKHWVIISVNIGFIPMGCILRQACCECDYFIPTFNDNFQCMGNDSCCIFIHLTGDRKNRHWTSNLFLHNKFFLTINDQNQIPYVVCLPRLGLRYTHYPVLIVF